MRKSQGWIDPDRDSEFAKTTRWITNSLVNVETEAELSFILKLLQVTGEYITIDALDVIRTLVVDKRCAEVLEKVDADTLRFVVNQKVFSKLPDHDYRNLMYSIDESGLNLPKINSHSSSRDILDSLYADAVRNGFNVTLNYDFELFVTRAVNQQASLPEKVNESSYVYTHMIAITYGEKPLREIITRLDSAGLNWMTCDLLEVVKNWDNLKQYSIDWVYNLHQH